MTWNSASGKSMWMSTSHSPNLTTVTARLNPRFHREHKLAGHHYYLRVSPQRCCFAPSMLLDSRHLFERVEFCLHCRNPFFHHRQYFTRVNSMSDLQRILRAHRTKEIFDVRRVQRLLCGLHHSSLPFFCQLLFRNLHKPQELLSLLFTRLKPHRTKPNIIKRCAIPPHDLN